MQPPPAVLLTIPAAYLFGFALVALSLGAVAVVAMITIAVRFGRLISLVDAVGSEGKETANRVSALRDRVIEIERAESRPLRAVAKPFEND